MPVAREPPTAQMTVINGDAGGNVSSMMDDRREGRT
jgi:hypothetical protein